MEITKESLNKRLMSSKNLLNTLDINHSIVPSNVIVLEPVVKINTPQVKSQELRVLSGALAKIDSVPNVAESLNLTEQQVKSARDSKVIESKIDKVIDGVSELALTRVMDCLGLLSRENLMDCKAKDLSIIASNLSRVHTNVRKQDNNQSGSPMLVIYSPQMNQLNHYSTVSVGAGQ